MQFMDEVSLLQSELAVVLESKPAAVDCLVQVNV